MTAPVVCVVDDDGPLRASLCDLMRSAGYVSHAFASADALLTATAPARIDCVLTDIHMLGRTGIELLRVVKSRHASVVVVVMTADTDKRWRAEAIACGATAFLEKPFDAMNLLEVIATGLGSRAEPA